MVSSVVALTTKDKHLDSIMNQDGVVGVGVGYLDPSNETSGAAIIVYVKAGLTPTSIEALPSLLSGPSGEEVPVRVEITGEFFANNLAEAEAWAFLPMAGHPEYARRIRPVQPGYSIGTRSASGTAGLIVINDPALNQLYIASNCHVINGNNDNKYYESIQPGGADGGISGRDKVGRVDRFVKLKKSGNYMDAATMIPDRNSLLNPQYPNIGDLPGHYNQYRVGWQMYKVGRTTGPVFGRVDSVHTDTKVNYGSYGGLGTIGFKDQTVIKSSHPVSLPGDSGSIWLRHFDKYACAVNYAGSGDGKTSIAFPFNWFAQVFKVLVARTSGGKSDVVQVVDQDDLAMYSLKTQPEDVLVEELSSDLVHGLN